MYMYVMFICGECFFAFSPFLPTYSLFPFLLPLLPSEAHHWAATLPSHSKTSQSALHHPAVPGVCVSGSGRDSGSNSPNDSGSGSFGARCDVRLSKVSRDICMICTCIDMYMYTQISDTKGSKCTTTQHTGHFYELLWILTTLHTREMILPTELPR